MKKPTLPRVPITDPAFQYTPASKTDLRSLFARLALESADAKKVRQILKGAKT